jgi:hypothetical protein
MLSMILRVMVEIYFFGPELANETAAKVFEPSFKELSLSSLLRMNEPIGNVAFGAFGPTRD